jgi:hypothetical protein
MAHFAEIDENNIVLRVIVVNDLDCKDRYGNESEGVGALFCHAIFGGAWKQTSYNGRIRKNYAGIGFKYDAARDAFKFAAWQIWSDLGFQPCAARSTLEVSGEAGLSKRWRRMLCWRCTCDCNREQFSPSICVHATAKAW